MKFKVKRHLYAKDTTDADNAYLTIHAPIYYGQVFCPMRASHHYRQILLLQPFKKLKSFE